MEPSFDKRKNYQLEFQGSGKDFFGINIVNWLLTIITLGFYYPWAKAKKLQFLYGATALDGDNFTFHGTGKEMFKGFIKVILMFFTFFILIGFLTKFVSPFLAIILNYLIVIGIIPLAIHGSYRYRMSRTSWRGIRFGYRGDKKDLYLNFFKWIFFTIITLGLYGSWLTINLRKYVISHIRFGSVEMDFNGEGDEYFVMNLKGYLLTIFTLGIYGFWWQKDLFNYYIDNISLHKEDNELMLSSNVTGSGLLKLELVNLLMIVFSLGFAYSWVVTRTLKYLYENIEIEGNIDLDTIQQTEENYKDATGEDIGDFLDIDFVM